MTDHAQNFMDLHAAGTFVLPNAWDAASAAVIAAAGAPAVATTSSGVSWAAGVPDGEHLSRDQAVELVARVVRAVDTPVSADVESGYGDVAATIAAVVAAGAVGANLEDRPGPGDDVLWPPRAQAERIAAARAAADDARRPFVLNARTDVYLAGVGEPDEREELVLGRAATYAEAGADCLFVPGLADIDAIARIAASAPLPLNVLLAPGRGPSIAALAAAGVRRISVGHLIAAAAYGTAKRATEELLAEGDAALRDALPHPELQNLMTAGVV